MSNSQGNILNPNHALFLEPYTHTNHQGKNVCKIHQSLFIDEIIIPEFVQENKKTKSHILKPQHIINVILSCTSDENSKEEEKYLNIEENEFCFIFSKIEKYRKGLWIIEPGYIHPNYQGPLSVHICNLSSIPILINKGDPIVEIVKFKVNKLENDHNKEHSPKEYIKKRKSESLFFPETFLDVAENSEKIKKQVGMEPFRNMLIVMLTVFSVVVGTAGWANWKIGKDIYESVIHSKHLEDIDMRNEILDHIKLELQRYYNEEKPSSQSHGNQ